MKRILFSLATSLLLVPPLTAVACGNYAMLPTSAALSSNPSVASNAIAALRASGPRGLDALLHAHRAVLDRSDPASEDWQRLRNALDAVGGQRDCHASGLFWHTNVAEATAAAKQSARPILSLRLLGKLTEEFSCANSRFFRTTLYANQELAAYLKKHFVLHWESVRPAPRITIAMGDGRTLERTITGNSIHYVLDPGGNVIDALPGLYSAQAFRSALERAEATALAVMRLGEDARAPFLREYHTTALAEINRAWTRDLLRAGLNSSPAALGLTNADAGHPTAILAMSTAFSKSMVERPLLRSLVPQRQTLEHSMNQSRWTTIAELHITNVVFDANTLALMRVKRGRNDDPASASSSWDSMLQALRRSIAEDTVRNEYVFHARLHEWLAKLGPGLSLSRFNSRVYAELFLTPESDPWLGLAPEQTFSALEGDGKSDPALKNGHLLVSKPGVPAL